MPIYSYKAVTQDGTVVRNKVEVQSKQELMEALKSNKLTPIHISIAKIEKTNSKELLNFTQNFYLLKKSGFDNTHALRTLVEGIESSSFKEIVEEVLAGVECGENMYPIMECYPKTFPYIYTNLIKEGETSDTLVESLEKATKYLEDEEAQKRKVKKIVIPNLVQLILLIALILVGIFIAIPTIRNAFEGLGKIDLLPAITFGLSEFAIRSLKCLVYNFSSNCNNYRINYDIYRFT